MSARNALVLTGGGARAAYQAGALAALGEILASEENPFPTLVGTSAGGINAAYLASRADNWQKATRQLMDLWLRIRLNDVYSTGKLSLSAIALAWISRTLSGGTGGTRRIANFLLDTKPLEAMLKREIDFPAIKKHIADGKLGAFALTAVQYAAQQTISFYDGHAGLEDWERAGRMGIRQSIDVVHVMASAAMPIFFPPIAIDGLFFGDGCIRQTNPLSPAIHLGADRILCIGIRQAKKHGKISSQREQAQEPSLAEIAGEVLNSVFLDSLDADIERLKRINESVRFSREHGLNPKLREIPILALLPSRNLSDVLPGLLRKFPPALQYLFHGIGVSDKHHQGQDLVSYLAFLHDCVEPLTNLGYEDTRARRDEILQFLGE